MMLVWGLAMILWLPWFEGQASYRDVFTSLRDKLPDRYQCIASYGIGESERSMLEYYAGAQARPLEIETPLPCDLLLVGFDRRKVDTASIRDWHVDWEGVRPRERPKEHYTLYHLSPRRGLHPQPLSLDVIRLNKIDNRMVQRYYRALDRRCFHPKSVTLIRPYFPHANWQP